MDIENSILNKIPNDELLRIVNRSHSFKEILMDLGLDHCSGGNYRTLKKRLQKDNIDLYDLNERRTLYKKQQTSKREYSFEEIFSENSKYRGGNKSIKRILLEKEIIKNVCSICNIESIWNKKPLNLQLDHINGDNCDNRIENLRLLCPNCHSQTETYCGRLKKKQKITNRINIDVLKELLKKNTIKNVLKILKIPHKQLKNLMIDNNIDYIKKKGNYEHIKKFEIGREELEDLVNKESFLKIGKRFKVSDNAIRKRCRNLGVEIPRGRRGYWAKVYCGKISV